MRFHWMLVLFACSGCAALIYEVVWFQLLQLVIGSSAISLGLVLATYMGGLCLGSILAPRVIQKNRHPLKIYALLELGIGCLALIVLAAVPWIARLYASNALPGSLDMVLRGLICAACLLPPTILMGATLPAASRWVESTRTGMAQVGLLYSANIVGAVAGCLLAGFYLLRVGSVTSATLAAVAINTAVAVVGFMFAARARYEGSTVVVGGEAAERASGYRVVYVAIGLSGLTALGAQVIWTRLLALMLGVTVYTFSIILAVFLVGLAAGAHLGSMAAHGARRPRNALAACQLALAATIAYTAYMLANVVPYWPIDPWLSPSPWVTFQVDLLRTAAAVLPSTLLWGASFPLALAAIACPGQDTGRLSAEAYASNTVGAIVGAFAFSIVLIPRIGTFQSERLLIALSALGALILFFDGGVSLRIRTIVQAAMCAGFAALLMVMISDVPWRVLAYGHRIASTLRAVDLYPSSATALLYRGEGVSSSIVIAESDTGQRSYHVSGKTEATTAPEDMRLQRMLGHIPALLHPDPRTILSWGFGAGVTAGSFVVHPGVQHMTICELEPLVPPASTKYFGEANYNVMNDPRTRVVYDDARHFLLTSKDRFDIITSDPLDPWAKGTAVLYTREFFEVIRRHLNPGGMFAQFVQLYESNDAVVKSELATFFQVFPDAIVWSNNLAGAGYDLVLLGRADSGPIRVDALQERLESPEYSRVLKSLTDVGIRSAVELLATYMGRPADFAEWLQDAQINRDVNLRLQYLGGLGINAGEHESIYRQLLRYRRFPEELFVGDAPRLKILSAILSRG